MQLAAEGKLPDLLGEIRGMHDAYEFVKEKSPWIGPNVSCVLPVAAPRPIHLA
jgi:hypothetical protein